MSIITKEFRDNLTPDHALELLIQGNQRMESEGQLKIVGGIHDIVTGQVKITE